LAELEPKHGGTIFSGHGVYNVCLWKYGSASENFTRVCNIIMYLSCEQLS